MKRLLVILTPLLIVALIWGAVGCGEEATPAPTITTGPTATPTATTGPTATAAPTAAATTTPTATTTPGASPTAAPTAPPTGTPTATPTQTATPSPTALPSKPEGELKIALTDLFGQNFDPVTSSVIPSKTYHFVLYDYLVGATPDGELSTENGIAEKWEHSADYLTWTFYIRGGVKFHNGDDLTPEDVKFSLEQLGYPKASAIYAKQIYSGIQDIAIDGSKVIVNLKSPNFFLDYQLSGLGANEGFVTPKKYIEANGRDHLRTNPIGSGPYRLAENVPNSFVKLEAVDNHWSMGVPKYKTITLYVAPEEITRMAMLKGGQADIVEAGRMSVPNLKKEGYNIFSSRLDDVVWLQFASQSGGSNPLSDPKVREALLLAIDTQAILDNLFGGGGVLESQPQYYPYVLGSVDLPVVPYDPERAKQLLKEAGYPERFATPTLQIDSFVRSGFPEGPAMLEAIAAYWIKIGVKMKIVPTDLATWAGLLYTKKLGPSVVYATYPQMKLQTGWEGNRSIPPGAYSFYTNPPDLGYDALLDEQKAAKTAEEYIAIGSKIMRYNYETSRLPTLFRLKRFFAANQKVTEWDLGMRYLDFLNLRDLAGEK